MSHQNLHINHLPANVLVEIFSYLKWNDDLKNITLTSTYFNEVVSSSSKVLRRIVFKCQSASIECLPDYNRHYTKFSFDRDTDDNVAMRLMEIAEDRVENIREFTLDSWKEISAATLIEFFKKTKNLKRVLLEYGYIQDKYYFDLHQDLILPKLKLDYLKVGYKYEHLEFFKQSSVKYLHIKKSWKTYRRLEKFLKNQEDLETLEIEEFKDYESLILQEYKFKLKTLVMRDCELTPNFVKFLQRHEKTLRNVTLRGTVTTDLINVMSGLENLNLKILIKTFVTREPLQIMTNVTSLKLSVDDHKVEFINFDQKFPNARDVHLVGFKTLLRPSTLFANVESLKLENIIMKFPVIIPKVKLLQFHQISFEMIRHPFDFNSPKIKEVRVYRCGYLGWIQQLRTAKPTVNCLHLPGRILRIKFND